jgi:hypothetical protein
VITAVATPGSPLAAKPDLPALGGALSPAELEMLRQRAGLQPSDTSKDAALAAAWEAAREVLENYLNRDLGPAGLRDEVFTHIRRCTVSLRAYPVKRIEAVITADGQEVSGYHVERRTGLVHFDARSARHELLVRYDADPPRSGAILSAQLAAFDGLWAGLNSSGQIAAATGAIKSISSDGARVEFDVGSGAVSASGIDPESGLPAQLVGLLAPYRREDA